MNWQPIATAPWDRVVLVTGLSGYKGYDKQTFIINAYRIKDWHQGEWNDVTGTRLSEHGWYPKEWCEVYD